MVWCRNGAARLPLPSSSQRSVRCASSWLGVKARRRAAASSMASGMPSSFRLIAATAARLSSVRAKSGSTARARSRKSSTASYRCSGSAPVAALGTTSGATGYSTSPWMRSGSRLVARIRTPGQVRSRVSAITAATSMTCSQLSSTNSTVRDLRYSTVAIVADCRDLPCRPSVAANSSGTSWGSVRPASATTCTLSNSRRSSVAIRSASRVLPIPPKPVSVTSRDSPISSRMRVRSDRRPTNVVTSSGRSVAASGNETASVIWSATSASADQHTTAARARILRGP